MKSVAYSFSLTLLAALLGCVAPIDGAEEDKGARKPLVHVGCSMTSTESYYVLWEQEVRSRVEYDVRTESCTLYQLRSESDSFDMERLSDCSSCPSVDPSSDSFDPEYTLYTEEPREVVPSSSVECRQRIENERFDGHLQVWKDGLSGSCQLELVSWVSGSITVVDYDYDCEAGCVLPEEHTFD